RNLYVAVLLAVWRLCLMFNMLYMLHMYILLISLRVRGGRASLPATEPTKQFHLCSEHDRLHVLGRWRRRRQRGTHVCHHLASTDAVLRVATPGDAEQELLWPFRIHESIPSTQRTAPQAPQV